MSGVKRYRPYYFDQTKVKGFDATMRENAEGGYVRWEDYERMRSHWEEACKQIGKPEAISSNPKNLEVALWWAEQYREKVRRGESLSGYETSSIALADEIDRLKAAYETKPEPTDSVLDQLVSDISVSKLLSFSDHRAILKLLRELKGRRSTASETCVTPQAPIAKAMVSGEGNVAWTTLYAPGLPHGLHDLYCEPEAAGPYLSGGPYRVEYTRCDCHPETCSCMPWTLYDGEQGIARGTDCSALWAIAHAANRSAEKSEVPRAAFVSQDRFENDNGSES